MKTNIELGDEIYSRTGLYITGTVIAIQKMEDNSILYTIISKHGYKLLEQYQISNWKSNPNCNIVSDIETYLGARIAGVADCSAELISKNEFKPTPQPRICAKCGQFDEYAAPSAKHNNEVRCYRHC